MADKRELSTSMLFWIYTMGLSIAFGSIWYFGIFDSLKELSPLYIYLINLVIIITIVLISEKLYSNGAVFRVVPNDYQRTDGLGIAVYWLIKLIPYKSILYILYILILIISQLNKLESGLLSNAYLEKFLASNEYSVVILIAVDRVANQIQKDKERIKRSFCKMKLTQNANLLCREDGESV